MRATPARRRCRGPRLPSRADLRPAFTKDVPVTLDDLRTIERHVKALAARVSPAVVAVEVGSGSGSGVVISADGLVLYRRACLRRAGPRRAASLSPTARRRAARRWA